MELLLNLAALLNLLFMIFVLFFERKEDSRRWAWFLVLYFLPVVGILLYILLSGHFFTKTKQLTRISHFFDGLTRQFFQEHSDFLKIFFQCTILLVSSQESIQTHFISILLFCIFRNNIPSLLLVQIFFHRIDHLFLVLMFCSL